MFWLIFPSESMAYGKWSKRERSLEPPSFRASKQLKMSFKNQTKVAMGITGQLLRTEGMDKNVVYSPLSIHVVLSMIASGASKGPSMDQLLYFLRAKSVSELNDLASSLVPLVFADGSPSGGPRLSFANGIWLEDSVSIKTPFKEAVGLSYKALLKQVYFKTTSEEVRCEVNAWVEKQTNGLIKDIIPPGLVDSSTDIILANALHTSKELGTRM